MKYNNNQGNKSNNNASPKTSETTNPYHFVPLNVKSAITDEPIWHDGSNSENLLTGTLRFSFRTLTPLLVGQWHTTKDQLTSFDALNAVSKLLPANKAVLQPLRLPDGRVVVPGSSLKGMLRQSLGALMSAPMERVAEHFYSYRPNAKFADAEKGPRPAIIVALNDGDIRIKMLQEPTGVYFIRKNDEQSFRGKTKGSLDPIGPIHDISPKIEGDKVKKYRMSSGGSSGKGYWLVYDGGIDSQGELHRRFKKQQNKSGDTYCSVWVKEKDFNEGEELRLPELVIDFYIKTLEYFIADDGLFTPGYPGDGAKEAKQNVKQLLDIWQSDRSKLVGRLIYVEYSKTETKAEITSMGHHYYYRWRYANSIRTAWNADLKKSVVRTSLRPLKEELAKIDGKPEKLSAARLLFGYASQSVDPEEQTGACNIGEKDYQRLAGRIRFSSAVEVLDQGLIGTSNTRFLEEGKFLRLKPLGQPRPSAVEHYLSQPGATGARERRNDGGILLTYGDLPGTYGDPSKQEPTSPLAGRKFYLHQPNAATEKSIYEDIQHKYVDSEQASLARYVSKPGARFRFTLSFDDFRLWELGALLIALEPNKYLPILLKCPTLSTCSKDLLNKIDQFHSTKDQPLFAHKLGYAKPLGFGSVIIECQNAFVLSNEADKNIPSEQPMSPEVINQAIDAFADKLKATSFANPLERWCALMQYAGRTCSAYPVAESRKDRKTTEEIYQYHTNARNAHIKGRRKSKDNAPSPDYNLPPLAFNPPTR